MTALPLLGLQSLAPVYRPEGAMRLAESPVALSAVVAASVALIVATIWCSLRERTAIKSYQWRLIMMLRAMAFVAVLLSLAGWQKRPVTESTEPSRVVLLVDSSTSMQLPAETGAEASRQQIAAKASQALVEALQANHEVVRAHFDTTVRYPESFTTAIEPGGAATRLGDAILRTLEDHPGASLAGLIVLSDGRSNEGSDPNETAQQSAERGVPIHTMGFGPDTEPPGLEIDRLEAPRRVFANDPFKAEVVLSSRGGFDRPVEVVIRVFDQEGTPLPSGPEVRERVRVRDGSNRITIDFDPPPPGKYLIQAKIDGAPQIEAKALQVPIESVDRKTTVLLLAGGPTREYRFLRDQLHRDRSYEVDVLLQTSLGGVSQDARQLVLAAPEDAEGWNAYDAVVALDPDWRKLGPQGLEALREWVARRGGGLLLVQGPVQGAGLNASLPEPIALLAPVVFSADPLDALTTRQSTQPRPISITPAGLSVDYLRLGGRESQKFWSDFGGFFASLPTVSPKMGAVVHARLGSPTGADPSDPLIVEHYFGAGRVAYLATGEVWRLRRVGPAYFTEFYTKLLRRMSQGRLLGAQALGSLAFDRARYDTGESMTLRLTLVDHSPATQAVLTPIVKAPDGSEINIEMTPLAEQSGWVAQVNAGMPGLYEAVVDLGGGGESPLQLSAKTKVSLPALESRATTQDPKTLREIAAISGGIAVAGGDVSEAADAIAKATPSRAETRITIGPPDPDYGRKLARRSLILVVGLLTTEWVLRRLWRLA